MTKSRFISIAGACLLSIILFVVIFLFSSGYTDRQVLSILSLLVPTFIFMSVVAYYFWYTIWVNPKQKNFKNRMSYADRKIALDSMPNVKKIWGIFMVLMTGLIIYAIFFQRAGFPDQISRFFDPTYVGFGSFSNIVIMVLINVFSFIITCDLLREVYYVERFPMYVLIFFTAVSLISYATQNLLTSEFFRVFIPAVVLLIPYLYIYKKVYSFKVKSVARKSAK